MNNANPGYPWMEQENNNKTTIRNSWIIFIVLVVLAFGYIFFTTIAKNLYNTQTTEQNDVDMVWDFEITSLDGLDFIPGEYENKGARPENPGTLKLNEAVDYNNLIIDLSSYEYLVFSEYVDGFSWGEEESYEDLEELIKENKEIINVIESVGCFYGMCELKDLAVNTLNGYQDIYNKQERERLDLYFGDATEEVLSEKSEEINQKFKEIDDNFSKKQHEFAEMVWYEIE